MVLSEAFRWFAPANGVLPIATRLFVDIADRDHLYAFFAQEGLHLIHPLISRADGGHGHTPGRRRSFAES